MRRRIRNGLGGGVFAVALACAGAAMAQQQQGTTSGPAAGNTVEPSTATQKKTMNKDSQSGSMSSGAPGVAAKPGSESGPAPEKKADQ